MMMKMIRANWVDLAQGCGVVAGIFLAANLITAGVLLWASPDSSVTISGILLPAAAGLMILVVTASYLAITFDQLVRFSLTRRRALGLLMGMVGAQTLCSMGLAALLAWVERAAAPMLWKAISGAESVALAESGRLIPEPGPGSAAAAEAVPSLLVVDMHLDWWWYPAIALAAIALGLIIGGVLQRFGGKGGWFLWAIWMAAVFGRSLFGSLVFLKDLVPLMVVLLAGSLVWSVWSLLHAVVKN